jgi:hypothetical protein
VKPAPPSVIEVVCPAVKLALPSLVS